MPCRLHLLLLLSMCLLLSACDSGGDDEPPTPRQIAEADYTVSETGLKYFDFNVGSGAEAEAGRLLIVHYHGWLTNGQLFDSSILREQPINFILGTGQVISGWEEGLTGMRVGGQRQLVIPPNLAYGAGGNGAIPPNSTLIFEVELVDVITEAGVAGPASRP